MNRPTPYQRNPMKAIRRNCLACCGGSSRLVAECPSAKCALWPFRSGVNPFRSSRTQKPQPPIVDVETARAAGCDDE